MKTIEQNNRLIAEFMGFEDAARFVTGGPYMRKKTEWRYGCQQYKEIKYEDLKYHTDWNLSVEVYHIVATNMWDNGIDDSYFHRDYTDCVARNAPAEAAAILASRIRITNENKKL